MVVDTTNIWNVLADVSDPEIPVLSILDLGVVRNIEFVGADGVLITITPTYSGCPAMDAIAMNIRLRLLEEGIKDVQIKYQLSPAWTTDWMSEEGKQKLKAYGIAPPLAHHNHDELFADDPLIPCPQCGSVHTEFVSQFGSTSCKAHCRCLDCKEPFDYFKCHR